MLQEFKTEYWNRADELLGMSIRELKYLAVEAGVNNYGLMTKAQIVEALLRLPEQLCERKKVGRPPVKAMKKPPYFRKIEGTLFWRPTALGTVYYSGSIHKVPIAFYNPKTNTLWAANDAFSYRQNKHIEAVVADMFDAKLVYTSIIKIKEYDV